jgi:hypothetical protein
VSGGIAQLFLNLGTRRGCVNTPITDQKYGTSMVQRNKNGTKAKENLKKEKKTITIKYTSKIIAKGKILKRLYKITTIIIITTNTLIAMLWIFER